MPRVWCQNEISIRELNVVSFLIRHEMKFYLGVQSTCGPTISLVKALVVTKEPARARETLAM